MTSKSMSALSTSKEKRGKSFVAPNNVAKYHLQQMLKYFIVYRITEKINIYYNIPKHSPLRKTFRMNKIPENT